MAEARQHVRNIFVMTKNSLVTIISLFVYCAIYSFIGYFVYKNSLEGYSFFQTPSIAFYEMFVLVTTSNFPGIMLPAYNENRWNAIFFLVFLLIGLYFL